MRLTLLLVSLLALPAAAQASQSADPPGRPAVFDSLLACFDAAAAALEAAEAGRDIIVMDRQKLQRTRRTLFGFALPDLDLFGDGNDDPEAVTELNAKIRRASQNAYGRWTFELEDGARWAQVDSREFPREPRPGMPIRIRRGAMASYLANVDGQVAVRVRRVQ